MNKDLTVSKVGLEVHDCVQRSRAILGHRCMVYGVNNWMLGMALVLVSILLTFFVVGRRHVRPAADVQEVADTPDVVPEPDATAQPEIVPIGAM